MKISYPLLRLFSYFLNLHRHEKTSQVLSDPRIVVGKHTYGLTSSSVNFFRDDDLVTIGNFCSIAEGVKILVSGEHCISRVSSYPFFAHFLNKNLEKDTFTKGEVRIGNDVWIGAKALILSGVNIGDGAVIAAGALVTDDVAPYSVVGGVPAKYIKPRFSDEISSALLEIKWWHWDDDLIHDRIEDFYSSVSDFVAKYNMTKEDS
jgi:acetyltransferase-like isoleucine patch superfamily enzyme